MIIQKSEKKIWKENSPLLTWGRVELLGSVSMLPAADGTQDELSLEN